METYLVGGAVRDQLLEYPWHERDWVVVGATPEEMIALGFQPVGKDFPVFLHPKTKEEYALARTERKTAPGYTGFDCYTSPDVTLEQDLSRRDLTINAMAQTPQGEIVDPYNGRGDIQAKLLRHVSPAFTEDPLRVLRVARFAARYAHLGFTVAPETLQLMQTITDSGELATLPAERIWRETELALGEHSPQQFFITLKQCGALTAIAPDWQALTPDTLAALAHAAETRQPSSTRFALLFIGMDQASTQALCSAIKAPNEFRDLALLVSRLGDQLRSIKANASELLDMLEAADAFRKPKRFEQLLNCAELLYDQPETRLLRKALTACQQVDPKSIVASGLKGKAIAEELRRQRIKVIASELPAV